MPEALAYDPADGHVAFDRPTTVVIAGKPRLGIMYVDAGVVAAWEHYDQVEDSRKRLRESAEAVEADG